MGLHVGNSSAKLWLPHQFIPKVSSASILLGSKQASSQSTRRWAYGFVMSRTACTEPGSEASLCNSHSRQPDPYIASTHSISTDSLIPIVLLRTFPLLTNANNQPSRAFHTLGKDPVFGLCRGECCATPQAKGADKRHSRITFLQEAGMGASSLAWFLMLRSTSGGTGRMALGR